MFDHSRLTRRESLLLRAVMTVVAGCLGFIILTVQVMVMAEVLVTQTVSGTAVPAPKTLSPGSQCFGIDWHELDADGRPYTPFDANRDGMIDCDSDIELGS